MVFGGYTLIYAASAAGGRHATEPWAVFYSDAYEAQAGNTTAAS